MTFEHFVIVTLLIYSAVREWMFWRQSQKLIDKLMSKNYYDYEYSRKMDAPTEEAAQEKVAEQELPDVDVNALISSVM